MITIGSREFKNEKELCRFLENLVDEGEEKMSKGEISSLCHEDMIAAWDDMVEKAHDEGWLTEEPHLTICRALNKNLNKPYPNGATALAIEEMHVCGINGLSTIV